MHEGSAQAIVSVDDHAQEEAVDPRPSGVFLKEKKVLRTRHQEDEGEVPELLSPAAIHMMERESRRERHVEIDRAMQRSRHR